MPSRRILFCRVVRLSPSHLSLHQSSSESSTLVSKELALQQSGRDGGTVHAADVADLIQKERTAIRELESALYTPGEVRSAVLELQPKLLRAIQEQEFERLGSARTIHVPLTRTRNCAQKSVI